MKNANIFIDVDLTLIDADGALLPGAREGLEILASRDCHLYLWSSNGRDYAVKAARVVRCGASQPSGVEDPGQSEPAPG